MFNQDSMIMCYLKGYKVKRKCSILLALKRKNVGGGVRQSLLSANKIQYFKIIKHSFILERIPLHTFSVVILHI